VPATATRLPGKALAAGSAAVVLLPKEAIVMRPILNASTLEGRQLNYDDATIKD
jgi:hypothetical protein